MNKLIIDNRTNASDLTAIELIHAVIKQGRISNNGKQYCYGTAIKVNDKKYMVSAYLNKKSERFVITNSK